MRKSSGQIHKNPQSRPELIPGLLPVSDCWQRDNRGADWTRTGGFLLHPF
ncbi:hypothetical protein BS47DRAFT_1345340 [Hydnum rufescens UP504]|uniref:Uncharacterized protein n=1 Tax=Hydnum rufescens UP504 TaxID=1448309 RepID=A0A9P6AV82_9AGAM|nr:hypothetical protein BS47DRAFT_1345340 [Hydnum rufescens UP504]